MLPHISRAVEYLPKRLAGQSVLLTGAFGEAAPILEARGAKLAVAGGRGRIDYVLAADIHEQRNPLLHIEQLAARADKALLLHLPPPPVGRWPGAAFRSASRLPSLVLWPARRKGGDRQAFHASADFLRQYLKGLRQDLADIGIEKTDTGILVVAHKRSIGHLFVLAGVPAIGKSTLLQHLLGTEGEALRRKLAFDPGLPWLFSTYASLLEDTPARLEYAFVQYNISAPLTHGPLHRYGFGVADLIRSADKTTIVSIWAAAATLRDRYFRERRPQDNESEADYRRRRLATKLQDVSGRRGDGSIMARLGLHMRSPHMKKKEQRFLSLYSSEEDLNSLYEEWFTFTEELGCPSSILLQEPEYKLVSLTDWRKARARP